MKTNLCKDCVHHVPHYIVHEEMGVRQCYCGHCKKFTANQIKKMITCPNYEFCADKDKLYTNSVDKLSMLVKIETKLKRIEQAIKEKL